MLLIIDDRNTDIQAMLHHCPVYASLMHDMLGLHNNRLHVTVEKEQRSYDMDSASDPFWRENRALGWHAVVRVFLTDRGVARAFRDRVPAIVDHIILFRGRPSRRRRRSGGRTMKQYRHSRTLPFLARQRRVLLRPLPPPSPSFTQPQSSLACSLF
jgi:hypothetical protein